MMMMMMMMMMSIRGFVDLWWWIKEDLGNHSELGYIALDSAQMCSLFWLRLVG